MDSIDTLLSRGVDTIYPSRQALEKVLRAGKKLKLYQGFDPTGTQLHIGHAVGFRKLRQWQDLGHEVIFLIGDGTGQAGDPTGKKKTRDKFYTRQELKKNGRDYVMQSSKIMRFEGPNPVKILYNGDWLNKLTLVDILQIAQNFSVQQLIERDMFQERIKHKESINLREFLYPLLQGYDSVAMEVDLELGGSDQTFNMLCGRTLVQNMLGKEKFVMTTPLLTDSKGTKIGKTEGNVIGLTDLPNDFYGKIMSLGDDAIIPCFTLLTDTPIDEINNYEVRMANGENPVKYKKQLAFELTKQFNTTKDAQNAQENFEKRFQEKQITNVSLPTVSLGTFPANATVIDHLVNFGLATSKNDAKRLVEQKGVRIDGILVTVPKELLEVHTESIFEVGKKAVKIVK